MMINLRDKDGNLCSKDILDINLDMGVVKVNDNLFELRINYNYIYNDKFQTKEAAEEQLIWLANCRNQQEEELRNF